MSRIKIKLPTNKIQEVINIAHLRSAKESLFGHGGYGDVYPTSKYTHTLGILGEAALSEYLNLPINDKIYDTHGDDGTDVQLPHGEVIDIKTTTYKRDPFLRIEKNKIKPKVDFYVCCYVHKNRYNEIELIGWATKTRVLNEGRIKKFVSNGPTNYVLEENQLYDMELLKCLAQS